MKNLKVTFRRKSNKYQNYLEACVTNENNTTRVWRHELERGTSALAIQMNNKIFQKAEKAVEEMKSEFESGVWDEERFHNQVV